MFCRASDRIGCMTVTEPPLVPYGLVSKDVTHELGFIGAPGFYLDQPPSPDDAWDVGPLDGGRAIAPVPAAESASALAAWLPEEHRAAGLALARHLPPGEYWWLRSRCGLAPAGEVLLGNEWVETGPEVREFWQSPQFYTAVVGAMRDREPDIHQPLLGVAVLNYDGTEARQGVLFFACGTPSAERTDERLLIIPRAGALVLDNLGRFSTADSDRCRARWEQQDSSALAHELASSGGEPGTSGKA